MTATLLVDASVASGADDAPGSQPSREPGAEFDSSRAYFPEAAMPVEAPYLPLFGPLTATPNATLADIVRRVTA